LIAVEQIHLLGCDLPLAIKFLETMARPPAQRADFIVQNSLMMKFERTMR